jgi:hypothetical protein
MAPRVNSLQIFNIKHFFEFTEIVNSTQDLTGLKFIYGNSPYSNVDL